MNVQSSKEATSWDVIECDVCGSPMLLLYDADGECLAHVHLDGDSLDDLIAVLIDLSDDGDGSSLPESAALQ
jgi:hypothetical protein